MAVSLKSIIPELAKLLEMTPAAIYERQRALVRAGLLKSESGRGPGSGVLATPESLAMLLIAILATESLSEAAELTGMFANLKIEITVPFTKTPKQCPTTGKRRLADALAAVLASKDLTAQVSSVLATRGRSRTAFEITFRKQEDFSDVKISSFGSRRAAGRQGGISRQAGLAASTFAAIASILREASK
jgi:hypothetical protein